MKDRRRWAASAEDERTRARPRVGFAVPPIGVSTAALLFSAPFGLIGSRAALSSSSSSLSFSPFLAQDGVQAPSPLDPPGWFVPERLPRLPALRCGPRRPG